MNQRIDIKPKSTKNIEKNILRTSQNPDLKKNFHNTIHLAKAAKSKLNKWDYKKKFFCMQMKDSKTKRLKYVLQKILGLNKQI